MGVTTDTDVLSISDRQREVERDERIRQLEKQCEVLSAEVDRQRPIVEAAIKWNTTNYRDTEEINFALDVLGEVCDDYQASNPK